MRLQRRMNHRQRQGGAQVAGGLNFRSITLAGLPGRQPVQRRWRRRRQCRPCRPLCSESSRPRSAGRRSDAVGARSVGDSLGQIAGRRSRGLAREQPRHRSVQGRQFAPKPRRDARGSTSAAHSAASAQPRSGSEAMVVKIKRCNIRSFCGRAGASGPAAEPDRQRLMAPLVRPGRPAAVGARAGLHLAPAQGRLGPVVIQTSAGDSSRRVAVRPGQSAWSLMTSNSWCRAPAPAPPSSPGHADHRVAEPPQPWARGCWAGR